VSDSVHIALYNDSETVKVVIAVNGGGFSAPRLSTNSDNWAPVFSSLNINTRYTLIVSLDSTSSRNCIARLNGVEQTNTLSSAARNFLSSDSSIILGCTDLSKRKFNGNIGEFIMYDNAALTSGQMQEFENYVTSNYGALAASVVPSPPGAAGGGSGNPRVQTGSAAAGVPYVSRTRNNGGGTPSYVYIENSDKNYIIFLGGENDNKRDTDFRFPPNNFASKHLYFRNYSNRSVYARVDRQQASYLEVTFVDSNNNPIRQGPTNSGVGFVSTPNDIEYADSLAELVSGAGGGGGGGGGAASTGQSSAPPPAVGGGGGGAVAVAPTISVTGVTNGSITYSVTGSPSPTVTAYYKLNLDFTSSDIEPDGGTALPGFNSATGAFTPFLASATGTYYIKLFARNSAGTRGSIRRSFTISPPAAAKTFNMQGSVGGVQSISIARFGSSVSLVPNSDVDGTEPIDIRSLGLVGTYIQSSASALSGYVALVNSLSGTSTLYVTWYSTTTGNPTTAPTSTTYVTTNLEYGTFS
jgi:hypothetical protein